MTSIPESTCGTSDFFLLPVVDWPEVKANLIDISYPDLEEDLVEIDLPSF